MFETAQVKENEAAEIQTQELEIDWSYLKHKNWAEMSIVELMERAKMGNPTTGMPYKTKWIVYCILERPNPRPLLEEFASLRGYLPGWVDKCINEHANTQAKRIIREFNIPKLNTPKL